MGLLSQRELALSGASRMLPNSKPVKCTKTGKRCSLGRLAFLVSKIGQTLKVIKFESHKSHKACQLFLAVAGRFGINKENL